MTKQERIAKYLEMMEQWVNEPDIERAHSHADDILGNLLRELGYGEVVDRWELVDKWYS